MTTKKLLITGLDPKAAEDDIRTWLGLFGPVERIDFIREGSSTDLVALVEMAIGDAATAYLLSRLTDYWHDGRLVNARLLHH